MGGGSKKSSPLNTKKGHTELRACLENIGFGRTEVGQCEIQTCGLRTKYDASTVNSVHACSRFFIAVAQDTFYHSPAFLVTSTSSYNQQLEENTLSIKVLFEPCTAKNL